MFVQRKNVECCFPVLHAWQTQLDISESKCAVNVFWNSWVEHDETPSCLGERVWRFGAGATQQPEVWIWIAIVMVQDVLKYL